MQKLMEVYLLVLNFQESTFRLVFSAMKPSRDPPTWKNVSSYHCPVPSHFFLFFFLFLARSGHVLHQERKVLLARQEGNSPGSCYGILWCFIHFLLLLFVLNGFLPHVISWCLEAGFLYSVARILLQIFSKIQHWLHHKFSFFLTWLRWMVIDLFTILFSTQATWYLRSLWHLNLKFIFA